MPLNKYRNRRTTTPDGLTFDSKAEAARYQELQLLQKAGAIRHLRCQVHFPLQVCLVTVTTYIADFCYEERDILTIDGWVNVVEDVKSPPTRKKDSYRIKFRWMAALGTPIREYLRPRS